MIHKHVDIWAILLLLLGLAVITRTRNIAVRVAHARLHLLCSGSPLTCESAHFIWTGSTRPRLGSPCRRPCDSVSARRLVSAPARPVPQARRRAGATALRYE